jgi:hypothetical protein
MHEKYKKPFIGENYIDGQREAASTQVLSMKPKYVTTRPRLVLTNRLVLILYMCITKGTGA